MPETAAEYRNSSETLRYKDCVCIMSEAGESGDRWRVGRKAARWRKVRTPKYLSNALRSVLRVKGNAPGNARGLDSRGFSYGQCHRNETAGEDCARRPARGKTFRRPVQRRTGKGETVG